MTTTHDQFVAKANILGASLDNPLLALDSGLTLLRDWRLAFPTAFESHHKGTPFYWLGMAAFLIHDYETAVYFFDEAVSEDLSKGGADPKDSKTPALKFLYIEGNLAGQAAKSLVEQTQSCITGALNNYAQLDPAFNLTIADIQTRFLRRILASGNAGQRTIATTFLSYFLEQEYRSRLAHLATGAGTSEPFILHLLKGAILFESLLKANPTNHVNSGWNLERALKSSSSRLGIRNDIKINAKTFAAAVAPLSNTKPTIELMIQCTGMMRNTLAHNLGWQARFDASKYAQYANAIANSCLHLIFHLYP